ncbi:MAG: serine hydrolase [Planctomycetota bacterium]
MQIFPVARCVLASLLVVVGSGFVQGEDRARPLSRAAIDARVQQEIDDGMFLGAVVIAGRPGEILFHKAYGQRDLGKPMTTDCLFDVASITKPATVATALALTLDKHPEITLDDRMRKYLPAMTGKGADEITIRHTATHRSGLDNTKQLQRDHQGEQLLAEILRRDIRQPVGSKYEYSCLGMIRLSEMIAGIHGTDFGRLCREKVFEPLGMNDTRFGPVPKQLRERCVVFDQPAGVICDPNARKIGRAVGNAGLFTTAEDLSKLATLWLQQGEYAGKRLFSSAIAEEFTRAGIVWRTAPSSNVPENLSSRTFSHTGHTGQSLLIDPELNAYVIVLTNWQHESIRSKTPNDTSDAARTRIAATVVDEVLRKPTSAATAAETASSNGAGAVVPPWYEARWGDPALQKRIDENIERYRKADAVLTVVDAAGNPVPKAEVRIEQLSHTFLFGCNAFVLGQLDTAEKNRKYEERFAKLFNFASVPFYWAGTEPVQGELRYAEGGKDVWRRPPPDRFKAFAERYGITLKGHPLVWHTHNPDWLPQDAEELKRLYQKRFREIAARYADHITIWDGVNESLVCKPPYPLCTEDRAYVPWAFREITEVFPRDCTILINDVTQFNFRGTDGNPYSQQLKRLRADSVPIEGIGFQYHLFSRGELDKYLGGVYRGQPAGDPQALLDLYEHFGQFGLPLWITEITIPSAGTSGHEIQARVVRDLYRLWFSVPRMAGITWWNLGDSLALQNENKADGGLLDEQFDPKPAYRALVQLIDREWKTRLSTTADDDGELSFRGFLGRYRAEVKAGGKAAAAEFEVNGDAEATPRVVLE